MITISFPHNLQENDLVIIKDMMRVQSSMVRSAYAAAANGLAEIEIRKILRERYPTSLDSWFQQSAIKKGIGDFKSDNELSKPSRIYGGKRNFIRRCNGLITNEEFKELRLLPLYLIGESPAKGNRKFDFYRDKIIFKPRKGESIEIMLPVLRNNWKSLYENAILLADRKMLPITVSINLKNIFITFDNEKVKTHKKYYPKAIKTRYAGIDLNPNYIGVSIIDNSKVIDFKLFSLKLMTEKHSNDNKLKHETIEVGHAIGRWLKHMQVETLFLESLSFKQGDKGLGKNFNRLTQNKWKRDTLKLVLSKYYSFIEVNAAYSSTIGNLLNPTYPDPVAASIEIARRGFECIIKKTKKFYPDLISKRDLEDRWKETKFPDFNTWKELHDFLKKKAKLRYRVPLPPEESFRVFQSQASKVGLYEFLNS